MEMTEVLLPLCETKTPFTGVQIQKAAEILKNRKGLGDDDLIENFSSYGPPVVKEGVANLLNNMANTGDYLDKIKQGILEPIRKQEKMPGPPSNLRPIMLASALRTFLAICIIRRCSNCISTKISKGQAAYLAG